MVRWLTVICALGLLPFVVTPAMWLIPLVYFARLTNSTVFEIGYFMRPRLTHHEAHEGHEGSDI